MLLLLANFGKAGSPQPISPNRLENGLLLFSGVTWFTQERGVSYQCQISPIPWG